MQSHIKEYFISFIKLIHLVQSEYQNTKLKYCKLAILF